MAQLAKHFPEAQFLITGVLGPHATRTDPTSSCMFPTPPKKLTACVAFVLAALCRKRSTRVITIYHLDTSRSSASSG